MTGSICGTIVPSPVDRLRFGSFREKQYGARTTYFCRWSKVFQKEPDTYDMMISWAISAAACLFLVLCGRRNRRIGYRQSRFEESPPAAFELASFPGVTAAVENTHTEQLFRLYSALQPKDVSSDARSARESLTAAQRTGRGERTQSKGKFSGVAAQYLEKPNP
jgi:hypothetical protein